MNKEPIFLTRRNLPPSGEENFTEPFEASANVLSNPATARRDATFMFFEVEVPSFPWHTKGVIVIRLQASADGGRTFETVPTVEKRLIYGDSNGGSGPCTFKVPTPLGGQTIFRFWQYVPPEVSPLGNAILTYTVNG